MPAADGKLRFWRNTSVATLTGGPDADAARPGTLGYEWDRTSTTAPGRPGCSTSRRRRSPAPRSSTRLRQRPSARARDAPPDAVPGAPSGALVFGAGTVQWAWGLDVNHDVKQPIPRQPADPDDAAGDGQPVRRHGRAAARRCMPAWCAASRVHRHDRADLDDHLAGDRREPCSERPVTITGTATDTGGGVVAGVEVSVDGGADVASRPTGRDELDLHLDAALGSPTRRRSRPARSTTAATSRRRAVGVHRSSRAQPRRRLRVRRAERHDARRLGSKATTAPSPRRPGRRASTAGPLVQRHQQLGDGRRRELTGPDRRDDPGGVGQAAALSGWQAACSRSFGRAARTPCTQRHVAGTPSAYPGRSEASGTTGLPLNAWSHLAATYDGTTLNIYVNGTLVSTVKSGTIPTTTGVLRIGGDAPGVSTSTA